MKLIRPSEHILELLAKNLSFEDIGIQSCVYAKLLKHKYHIGMFVCTDNNGELFKEPPIKEDEDYIDAIIQSRYDSAKAQVIFKDFEYVSKYEVRNKNLTINFKSGQFIIESFNGLGGGDICGETLEDLAMCDLNLEMI